MFCSENGRWQAAISSSVHTIATSKTQEKLRLLGHQKVALYYFIFIGSVRYLYVYIILCIYVCMYVYIFVYMSTAWQMLLDRE